MATAIKVENLSKIYRLGEIGTGTISRDLERFVKTKILKQEDPFLKIGEANDRATKGESDIVYSLKDINFEIEQGDAVGIIGRNGAGKSTLLKILSRVTSPTTGKINIKGRVASLLEVGTGFHPELTGRENIYLNGAILGMRKKEIDRKFDEIVDFSGVERYIDTPVKRYSSGMYVRLAFAVAAHLESEILIVDEVLAVGDAEFQKKCLGKMGEVSKGEGRTVLFVSHNMEAILRLCNKSIFIERGILKSFGQTNSIINQYINSAKSNEAYFETSLIKRNKGFNLKQDVLIRSVEIKNNLFDSNKIKYKTEVVFNLIIEALKMIEELQIGIAIVTLNDIEIISSLSTDDKKVQNLNEGLYEFSYSFPNLYLLPNVYKIGIGIRSNLGFEDYLEPFYHFEVLMSNESAIDNSNSRKGTVVPNCRVDIMNIK
jgi:lipopolysaccharide transport system ATP-binding protein